MANFQAYNDKSWVIPIQCLNPATMVPEAWPAGTVLSSSSGLPNSLSCTINGSNNLAMWPLVRNSLGIPVTVSGTGMAPVVLMVDVVTDPNAAPIISINTGGAVGTSQPVPTAPGP